MLIQELALHIAHVPTRLVGVHARSIIFNFGSDLYIRRSACAAFQRDAASEESYTRKPPARQSPVCGARTLRVGEVRGLQLR